MKIRTKSLKRTIIIIAVAIILVCAGLTATGYIVLSRANQTAIESVTSTRNIARDNLDNLNERLADGDVSRVDKLRSITTFKDQLATLAGSVCADVTNTVYYQFIQEHDRCQSAKELLSAAKDSLNDIETYIEGDSKLAELIPGKMDGLTFQQSYDLWAAAVAGVEGTVVADSLLDEKAQLVIALTAYRDAWKAVVEADASQNETAFVAAEKGLGAAHTQLIELSTSLSEPLGGLSADFTTKFEAFLSQTNAS